MGHMHADPLSVHSNLSPLLVHFQTIRKPTFGPDRIVEGGPKASFGTVYQSRDHEFFENPLLVQLHLFELDQKWVFEKII